MARSLATRLTARNGSFLRVVLIARISTDKQDEKSLADQKQLLKRWLKDHSDKRVKCKVLATQGSGERLDRRELVKLRRLIRSGRYDLVLAEDLGRICRRIDAFKICESCEDHDTRLIALNDNIDTGEDSWRMATFFAAMRHESYNADTAKRIRRTLRNRFTQGGVLQTQIFCYEKLTGAKTDADLQKIEGMDTVVEGIIQRLEHDWNYSEVADWLNDQQVPMGKWCRSQRWYGAMVRRVVFNPLLKGVRVRNRKMTRRVNSTGRRKSVNAPAEELLERACPHLAYIEAARYDRLIAELTRKNAHYAVGKRNKQDPRLGRPKKRTVWPGQHVTCGVCGRGYVYGGHGRTKYLMCSGSREYKCWNGVTFEATAAARKLSAAVIQAIEEIPDFDADFAQMFEQVYREQSATRDARTTQARSKLQRAERELENILNAIKGTGGSPTLYQELAKLEAAKADSLAELQQIEGESNDAVELPSLAELRQLAIESFAALSVQSHEFAKLMKRLIQTIVVHPYRPLDGGSIVLRAKFRIALTSLAPKLRLLPLDVSTLARELTVDLFEPPQRIALREQVMELIKVGTYQRETGAALGITQPAVQKAIKLDELMQRAGVEDPYQAVLEPPENYRKLRRHKHARYQFEVKQVNSD